MSKLRRRPGPALRRSLSVAAMWVVICALGACSTDRTDTTDERSDELGTSDARDAAGSVDDGVLSDQERSDHVERMIAAGVTPTDAACLVDKLGITVETLWSTSQAERAFDEIDALLVAAGQCMRYP